MKTTRPIQSFQLPYFPHSSQSSIQSFVPIQSPHSSHSFSPSHSYADHLNTRAQNLATQERKITAELISVLKKIHLKKYHLAWGYSGLFDYLVRGLGYSKGAASRRNDATLLACDISGLESDIASGSLSLNKAQVINQFFKTEYFQSRKKFSAPEKQKIVHELKDQSFEETQRTLAQKSSVSHFTEKRQILKNDFYYLHLRVGGQTKQKIDRAKEVLSHIYPRLSDSELFEILIDQFLKQKDPIEKAKQATEKANRAQVRMNMMAERINQTQVRATKNAAPEQFHVTAKVMQKIKQKVAQTEQKSKPTAPGSQRTTQMRTDHIASNHVQTEKTQPSLNRIGQKTNQPDLFVRERQTKNKSKQPVQTKQTKTPAARLIPSSIKHKIWLKNIDEHTDIQHQYCQYKDPKTGRQCGSKHQLQIDHKIPISKNGQATLENLQILCARHNQWKGAKILKV